MIDLPKDTPLPRVTLRQVEAFRAVMRTHGMTSAAQMLSISQPAVSRLIADMELGLGLKLFERNGPRLKPTDNALRLMEEVERVFLGLHQIEQAARTIKRFPQTLMRIAAPPFLSLEYVAVVVGALRRAYPELRFSIHTDSSMSIADQIARGSIIWDFAPCPPARMMCVSCMKAGSRPFAYSRGRTRWRRMTPYMCPNLNMNR